MKYNTDEILEIFRIGLQKGLFNQNEIINWADKELNKSESPESFLIDISLSKSSGINETLKFLKRNPVKSEIIRMTLYGLTGLRYRDNNLDLKSGCFIISQVAMELKDQTEYDLFDSSIDDSYYLASKGIYGNLNDVKDKFDKQTSPYISLANEFNNEINK